MQTPFLMNFDDAAMACNGELFESKTKGFTGVCIDSREIKKGDFFIALNGENVDGHSFVKKAFDGGAAGTIVEKKKLNDFPILENAKEYDAAVIAVDDTLHSFQNIAAAYLKKFPKLLRIGITGSSGKTTTKEIAAGMIGIEKKVVFNEGNFNTETGLPISVFLVREDHEVGIFEMGMNRFGEIAELSRVLRPNIALITNVGTAHIGFIGSMDGIAKEKKDIFSQFTGNETAFIPEYEKYGEFLREGVKGRIKSYGPAAFSGRGGKKRNDFLLGAEIIWEGISAHFSLPGEYNFRNLTGAIEIALEAGVSGDAIRKGIESVKPLFGRGEVFNCKGGITVVRDCYNANPESMREAIALCDAIDWKGRRIYILGSMLELGNVSKTEHENIGKQLMASNADYIYLFGSEIKPAYNLLHDKKNIFWTDDIDVLKKELKERAENGDLLLLKGSRGCKLERAWDI
ncbi:UDP-N-acetylmuramoyl-tripeptide--D-alanyl-D-alanine ligase [Spirochaetia bacterium]|nr:UDP-N-acetylmuramoyl-tripeptide--D-alanyl-D-alanine ligase [Spirochaetia bacterium]